MFSDKQVAHDYFVSLRFPNGVACPRQGCGSADVCKIKNRREWRCRECRRQFSVKVGTIFEDSPIGFDKWLPALWLLSANRNGISSCELARGLGVTQKTAWFMLHRIRYAMRTQTFEKLHGPVEADETYVGGLVKNRPLSVRALGPAKSGVHEKTPIMGIIDRASGAVHAWVLKGISAKHLQGGIQDHVDQGAVVYTDGAPAYRGLEQKYEHYAIDHAYEYVRGHITTNSIESFFAVFKRAVKGTYICPRAKHLQRYVEEQVFRFNERKNTDGPRFVLAARGRKESA